MAAVRVSGRDKKRPGHWLPLKRAISLVGLSTRRLQTVYASEAGQKWESQK